MNKSPAPELLAPAGGPDAGYAALHFGADAVYLGLRRFSARAEAENFTLPELEAFTAYAHSLTPRRLVYVTLNTLVRNDETGEAAGMLQDCADAGADAVIVQDLGLARIAQAALPGLELHASTQMAIHSREGVIGARQAGFTRVNVARELTLTDLRTCASVPGIQIETFVHGALCYSYSGLCLYSSLLRGRSGNRGSCAYPCRDRFKADHQPDSDGLFAFSMKDLALPEQISALREAGVASLKIEGRKKSPLYVATVTALYRRILDGGAAPEELEAITEDVKTVFSRPWTSLFSGGRRSLDTIDDQTVGHRGARVGDVISVRRTAGESRLRFSSCRPIERHDGIQVDVDGEDKPFGFSAQSLYTVGKDGSALSVFETNEGAMVEVTLPPGSPTLLPGAPVYCASSQKTKREYPFPRPAASAFRLRFRLDATIRVFPDRITADAEAFDATGAGMAAGGAEIKGAFTTAQDPPRSESAARDAFAKLGETPFLAGHIRFENPDSLFAPASLLNRLRRELTDTLADQLAAKRAARRETLVDSFSPERMQHHACPAAREEWVVAIDREETLSGFSDSDLASVDEVIFRLDTGNRMQVKDRLGTLIARIGVARLRVGLPLIMRDNETDETRQAVSDAAALGIVRWEVSGMGGRQILESTVPDADDIIAGWPLYALNRESAAWLLDHGYRGITISPEDGMDNILALLKVFGDRITVPVYLDPPMMISESCAQSRFQGGCAGKGLCSSTSTRLRSAHREQVVLHRDGCRSIVLNSAPFTRVPQMPRLRIGGARRFLAEFVHREWNAQDTPRIWREVRAGRNPDFAFRLSPAGLAGAQ